MWHKLREHGDDSGTSSTDKTNDEKKDDSEKKA